MGERSRIVQATRTEILVAKDERAWWLRAGEPIGLTKLYGWNFKYSATFLDEHDRMIEMDGRIAHGILALAAKLAIAEGRKP